VHYCILRLTVELLHIIIWNYKSYICVWNETISRPIYTIQFLPDKTVACNLLTTWVVCVNQAHNSLTLSYVSCVLDLHSTTQVVSRLHATVLGKSCLVWNNRPYNIIAFVTKACILIIPFKAITMHALSLIITYYTRRLILNFSIKVKKI
jgi:hypothetical protein